MLVRYRLTWTWKSRRVRLHRLVWSRRSLRRRRGVRRMQTLKSHGQKAQTGQKVLLHSHFSEWLSYERAFPLWNPIGPVDVAGVQFQADLTSSIDLDPWVKDSDAQRAGELIDPILKKETDKMNPSGMSSKPLIIIILQLCFLWKHKIDILEELQIGLYFRLDYSRCLQLLVSIFLAVWEVWGWSRMMRSHQIW